MLTIHTTNFTGSPTKLLTKHSNSLQPTSWLIKPKTVEHKNKLNKAVLEISQANDHSNEHQNYNIASCSTHQVRIQIPLPECNSKRDSSYNQSYTWNRNTIQLNNSQYRNSVQYQSAINKQTIITTTYHIQWWQIFALLFTKLQMKQDIKIK